MADKSLIEWTDATWTPIRARRVLPNGDVKLGWHCNKVDSGCDNCYAQGLNMRLGTQMPFKPGHLIQVGRDGQQLGDVSMFLDETMLLAPLRWKKPRMIFVCSMTDLFASFVPDGWIDRVFAVMALCPQHTFQVLTKRPDRAREYLTGGAVKRIVANYAQRLRARGRGEIRRLDAFDIASDRIGLVDEMHGIDIPGPLENRQLKAGWPLPNVWLGTSISDQASADLRIPDLLATPAAIRFVSAEPLLGPVDLTRIRSPESWGPNPEGWTFDALQTGDHYTLFGDGPSLPSDGPYRDHAIDWVICGGESGPKARPMHPDWARSLRDQCAAAGKAFFHKQNGEYQVASHENGHFDSDMSRNNAVWVDGADGTIHKPSCLGLTNPIGMVRVGKARAGRLLDGREHNDLPGGGRND
jgi:protein gp37